MKENETQILKRKRISRSTGCVWKLSEEWCNSVKKNIFPPSLRESSLGMSRLEQCSTYTPFNLWRLPADLKPIYPCGYNAHTDYSVFMERILDQSARAPLICLLILLQCTIKAHADKGSHAEGTEQLTHCPVKLSLSNPLGCWSKSIFCPKSGHDE